MSLKAFNGSIANPAQTNINLGTNSLSNATNIGATGAITAGQLNLSNSAYAQTINFASSDPSAPATGFISFSGFQDTLFVDANVASFNGQVSINASNDPALGLYGLGGIGAVIHGTAAGAEPSLHFRNFGSTGATGVLTYETLGTTFSLNDDLRIGNVDTNTTTNLVFLTSAFAAPLEMSYSSNAGYRCATYNGNSTYIFGPAGATAGATAAIPYLKVDGASGESRVYDPIYNPVPTASAYGQFSLNATVGVGSTGGTAGVADTATQLSLDTADTAVGCSLSSGGISVTNTGKYLITVSPQFFNTGSGNHNVYFWFRVNSTDVATSSTGIYLQGNQAQQVPTVSIVLNLTASDVVKVMAASDDNEIQVLNVAAISTPYVRPAAPAIIATIVRVA